MAIIKAKCTNYGNCDKADKREIMDIPEDDLKCPECSSTLTALDMTTGGGGGNNGKFKKIAIAVATVLLLGMGAWYVLGKTGEIDSPQNPRDEIAEKKDSLKITVDTTITKPVDTTNIKIDPIPPIDKEKEAPKPVSTFLAYGMEVPNSKRTVDCDVLYKIWDGKGGKIDQIKKLAGCDCGTEKVFASGYKYLIECENGGKRAKLISGN